MNEMLKCAWCKRTFKRPHTAGPVPTYCCALHRQHAHEKRKVERAYARVGMVVSNTEVLFDERPKPGTDLYVKRL